MSVENYRGKISGPMLDRIDMHVHLPRVDMKALQNIEASGEKSEVIKQRVSNVRSVQQRRGGLNSQLTVNELETFCRLGTGLLEFLAMVSEKLNLSARAYHRIIKLARTIADIENEENIAKHHLSEAISYRSLDRR